MLSLSTNKKNSSFERTISYIIRLSAAKRNDFHILTFGNNFKKSKIVLFKNVEKV